MKYVWQIFKLLVIRVTIHYHHDHVEHFYAELNPVWNFVFLLAAKIILWNVQSSFLC
jgi:hypothetical protein